MRSEIPFSNRLLSRFVDPAAIKVSPAAKEIVAKIRAHDGVAAEHGRQVNKFEMDPGEDHFFTQRQHLEGFLSLGDRANVRKELEMKFFALERRALLVQIARNIFGIHNAESQS